MDFETDADRLMAIQLNGGQEVTIGGTSVWAIFENDYSQQLEVSGSIPLLHCRTSDVSAVVVNTAVVVGVVNYTVKEIMPDGSGITVLRLEEDD